MGQLESVQRATPAWVRAAAVIGAFVGVLYLVELADSVGGGTLDAEGIQPRDTDGLVGILLAPLLHSGWNHLLANTVPLLVLGFLILLSGVGHWVAVTAIVWLTAGLGTWLTGQDYSVHLGASGLVFGWLVHLILRGFFKPPRAADRGRRAGAAPVRRAPVGRAPRPARRLLAGTPVRRPGWRTRRVDARRPPPAGATAPGVTSSQTR